MFLGLFEEGGMIDYEMRLEAGIRLGTDQVSGLASFRREMSRREKN